MAREGEKLGQKGRGYRNLGSGRGPTRMRYTIGMYIGNK